MLEHNIGLLEAEKLSNVWVHCLEHGFFCRKPQNVRQSRSCLLLSFRDTENALCYTFRQGRIHLGIATDPSD